jgi:hypothetical protein
VVVIVLLVREDGKEGKDGSERMGGKARNSEVEIRDLTSFEGVVRSSVGMREVEVDDRTAPRRDEVDDVGRTRTRKSSESRVGRGSLRRGNKKTMSANEDDEEASRFFVEVIGMLRKTGREFMLRAFRRAGGVGGVVVPSRDLK